MKNNGSVADRKLSPSIKLVIIIVLSIFALLFLFLWPSSEIETCLVDELHELTHPINREIACCGWKVVMGLGQGIMDLWVIFIMTFWLFFNHNLRFPTSIGLTFGFRILYMLVAFPVPIDIVWKNPGFFTFSVSYDHTRDFFFSGHTSTITLILLEVLLTKQSTILVFFCFLSTLFMIWMLITVRIHYTIDIVAALIHSLFCYGVVWRNLETVDRIWSFPFLVISKIKEKCCESKQEKNHVPLSEEQEGY